MVTGYFPPSVEFDVREMLTVIEVLKERNRGQGRR